MTADGPGAAPRALAAVARRRPNETGWRGPVAIGGVGGSGTRVVAAIVARAGSYLGGDLNAANDNLWFTLLFKRTEVLSLPVAEFECLAELFVHRMTLGPPAGTSARKLVTSLAADDRPQHSRAWLAARAVSFLDGQPPPPGTPWGWKEPNTHVVLDRLADALPDLRYIHVVRSGFDMATSANQNQPRLWGRAFGVDFDESPRASLKFWRVVHERSLRIGTSMPDRFLCVRFEDLCAEPAGVIEGILRFIGAEPGGAASLAQLVNPPRSLGRYHAAGPDRFDPEDVEFAANLGYGT